MEIVDGEFKVKVFCYYCGNCDERFYTEEYIDVGRYVVHCPHCGDVDVWSSK